MARRSSIQRKWTKLILATTSFIYHKKNGLLTASVFQSFWSVIQLIVAEIFLSVISLPRYFVIKSVAKTNESAQFKTRKIMTLSLLAIIFAIWFVKLLFIVLPSFLIDSHTDYKLQNATDLQEVNPELTSQIINAPIEANLPIPEIIQLIQHSNNTLTVRGSAAPNTLASIYISKKEDQKTPQDLDTLVMKVSPVTPNGYWEATIDKSIFSLAAGDYMANTMSYHTNKKIKSPTSQTMAFTIQEGFFTRAMQKLDSSINIILMIIIVASFFGALIIPRKKKKLSPR